MNLTSSRTLFYCMLLLIAAILPLGANAKEEQVVKVQNSTFEEAEDTLRTAGFGLSFGIFGANGFSYRSLPARGSGYQLGGIWLLFNDQSYFKLSAEYLYGLGRTRLTCFYFIGGVSYKLAREKQSVTTPSGLTNPNQWVTTASRMAVGAGFGFGTRKLLHERIWASVELPLTYDGDTLLPWPTASIHYLVW